MTDDLFVGASQSVDINSVLDAAVVLIARLGIPIREGDLEAIYVKEGRESKPPGIILDDNGHVRLNFRGADAYVKIIQWENEVVPDFTVITSPMITGVSVWVGADATSYALAASIAAAVASKVGSNIWDPEQKWSNHELNSVEVFISEVMQKRAGRS